MSNLESIVPPLELCKLIPEGEFAASALVYRFYHQQAGKMFPKTDDDNSFYYVEEREIVEFAQRNMVNPPPMFAAPMLEEILVSLSELGAIFCKCWIRIGIHSYEYPVNSKEAILLWFKVKGIEVKNENSEI